MPDRQNSAPSVQSRLRWAFGLLFSMKFGLVLLSAIALISIFGTLLPPPSADVSQLEFAQRMVYYTPWFQGLLLLLAVNILLATWRTLTTIILPSLKPRFLKFDEFYRRASPSTRLPGASIDQFDQALRARGFSVHRDGLYGCASKGGLSRWGAPVAHVGMAILLLAALASKWTVSEGQATLIEGEQTDQLLLTSVDPPRAAPLGFTILCDDFDTDLYPNTQIPSHFVSTVTLDEPGRPPRTETVEVNRTVSIDGWKLHQTSYRGLPDGRRYRIAIGGEGLPTTATLELSPGQRRPLPGAGDLELALTDALPASWNVLKSGKVAAEGVLNDRPDAPLKLVVERFEPDYYLAPGGEAASRTTELNNPAALVSVIQDGRTIGSQWLFGRTDVKAMSHGAIGPVELDLESVSGEAGRRLINLAVKDVARGKVVQAQLRLGIAASLPEIAVPAAAGPWRVRLEAAVPVYSTTISLTRNAAVPAVYAGCGLMFLGLLLAFFVRRCEVFYWFDAKGNQLWMAGVYRFSRETFDPSAAAAVAHLQPQPVKPEAA